MMSIIFITATKHLGASAGLRLCIKEMSYLVEQLIEINHLLNDIERDIWIQALTNKV